MPTFSAKELTKFAADMLVAEDVGREEAELVADSLVGANLRGYDSHGLMRIPFYLDRAKKGEVVPGAEFEVLRETPSLLTVDAHWGYGQTQARRLTERLIEKARDSGVGVGTMRHCSHVGRLGEYCEMAAEAGLVSMMMVNNHGAVRRVAPPGGKAPRLSTDPLAVGIPNGDEPLVLDFCTSVAAEGKVRVKQIAGELCPDGWLLDSEGRPTNDPNLLYADPPGSIRPMGGDQPYKGFALGLMVEIFSGALSGGVCSREVPTNPIGNCVFLMVLDPGHLGGAEHFAGEVSSLVAYIRGCPRVDGVDEILLPGDPERRTLKRRLAEGIALDEKNWEQLVNLAAKLGVDVPA
ncbi:MAG: dehydrogenase [Planctomycetes bacterium RBG_16_64_12]|nr:MAG: dehydrogenase [Planctomycetes bacterium RBG_16_64_12]